MYSMGINNQKNIFHEQNVRLYYTCIDEENQTSHNNELSQQMLLSLNESANI